MRVEENSRSNFHPSILFDNRSCFLFDPCLTQFHCQIDPSKPGLDWCRFPPSKFDGCDRHFLWSVGVVVAAVVLTWVLEPPDFCQANWLYHFDMAIDHVNPGQWKLSQQKEQGIHSIWVTSDPEFCSTYPPLIKLKKLCHELRISSPAFQLGRS